MAGGASSFVNKAVSVYCKIQTTPRHQDSVDDKQQWRFVANEMKNMLRLKQRALATERNYLSWLRRFYRFVKGQSPFSLDSTHVKNFLTHQAVDRNISKSTQNQAFSSLLFFFRYVLLSFSSAFFHEVATTYLP